MSGLSHSSKGHGLDLRGRLPVVSLGPLLRGSVALLLTFGALTQTLAGPVDITELNRIITAYYYAIGENRLEEAMSFYHQDSPQADEASQGLELGQSAYLQRTSTLSFDLVEHDGERAVVRATHRHLRIAGIKFMEEIVETRYVLRREGDAWRIWSSVVQSPWP